MGCTFNFSHQRRDPCFGRGSPGPGDRSARRSGPEAPYCDARNHELMGGPQCGRKWGRVEFGEHTFRLVQKPDQDEVADLQISCMRGVQPVAVLFEYGPRRSERFGGPTEVAGDERDLGLCEKTSCPCYGVFRTEGTPGRPQERLRPHEIPELCHRDPPKRQCRRILAQRDSLQCAKRITGSECTRCGRDYRVHRNPATLVTPTLRNLRGKSYS
jgi:hypothetical protein